jgi:hypothetical protein
VARKNAADAAKAKADKQKRLAIVLGVVLLLAVAYAGYTMMSLQKGGSASSRPQEATTTSALPAPTTTAAALPTAPVVGSAPPTSTTATSQSAPLIAAVQPPAGVGQLQSFSLFESKDPFNAGGPHTGSGAASSSSSSPSGGGGSSGNGGSGGSVKPPAKPPAPPAAPPASAVISVDGVSESVTSGSDFPASNPIFQLVSVTASSATVSVVGGSYASGAQVLTLTVNKAVTLVNTADGTRYTVELLPQGTQVTAPPSSGTTSTTVPATTTPSAAG